ncbi:TrbG/VirB9 family P-type conjugative transfer protein [Novosphingobium sp. FSY-8]|uniref:TrbG/VirB9 family P-type conjugative transfer protein n=1 Tax=Novosphingobium ovatum TaxID=1908523 RepID=A0ABW9XAU1_9SPHN|nr:TrbG/VirB9 family P-type conjugative transfer protein [Novosphingobium ovatum]NBC35634.1 TrbG/VirB9 family P-type conjugative transfer protein [Novosphingobium ovatum]
MRWCLLVLMALWCGAARAEVLPTPGPGDPHIQTVAYDPQQVVALHVANGFAVVLRFGADERIETVTLGDPAGWSVQANRRADQLVVRPLAPGRVTNLTVITDQRAYGFSLYGAAPGDGVQPYLLSFTYGDANMGANAGGGARADGAAQGRYRLSGEAALWPEEMSDDGTFTRMRWAADRRLPAIYAQGAGGALALVNGLMRDGVYVIEGVHARLVFVAGGQRAAATRIPSEGARP